MKALPFALAGPTCLALMLYVGAVSAQVDLSGNWQTDDQHAAMQLIDQGPPPVDFVGIPLNKDGRADAATANPAEEQEELHRQCQSWSVNYFAEGDWAISIRPITDPLDDAHILGWYMSGSPDRLPETVWVDGRPPPPPLALHTLSGFATGQWRGDTLDISVTHLKDSWLLRNDAPESNQETARIFLTREDDLLSMTFIIHDPVYLAAPYVRIRTWKLSARTPTTNIPAVNDCMPSEIVPGLSDGYHATRYLPGKNPDLMSMQQRYHIPPDIALGGREEIYPEFRKVLKKEYTVPSGYCRVDCCLSEGPGGLTCPAPAPASVSARRDGR